MNSAIINLLAMFFLVVSVVLPILNIMNFKKPKLTNLFMFLSLVSLSMSTYLFAYETLQRVISGDTGAVLDSFPTIMTIQGYAIIAVICLNFVTLIMYGAKQKKKSLAVKKVEEDMAKKTAKSDAKKEAKIQKKEAKKTAKTEAKAETKKTDEPVLPTGNIELKEVDTEVKTDAHTEIHTKESNTIIKPSNDDESIM